MIDPGKNRTWLNRLTPRAIGKPDILDGWTYRASYSFNNVLPAGTGVEIEFGPRQIDFSRFRTDGHDMRILGPSGELLPFWRAKWDSASQRTTVVILVPDLKADDSIQIAGGNPNAIDVAIKVPVPMHHQTIGAAKKSGGTNTLLN